MQKSNVYPQICAAVSASLIFISVGFHYAWLSPALEHLSHEEMFAYVTRWQYIWINNFLSIGGFFGSCLGAFLVDILGRKATLLLMIIPQVISCVLIAVATNHWWFYLARFIAGIVVGVAFVVTPMYIGEITDSRIRGGLGVLMTVIFHIGELVTCSIGSLVNRIALAIAGAVVSIVLAMTLIWAPESPYYYAMKKIPNMTLKSLTRLRGTPDVAQEVQQIHECVSFSRRSGINFVKVFTVRSYQKALITVLGLVSCRKLSIISIPLLLTHVFLHGPLFASNHLVLNIGLPLLTMLIPTIFVVFLADKVGRRSLLLASTSLCAFFLSVTALYILLHRYAGIDDAATSWVSLAVLIGYLASDSIGIGTIPIIVSGEIFPCEVKGIALGFSNACAFGIEIGIELLMPMMTMNGTFIYAVFLAIYLTVLNIASTIFIFFFLPETKRRSLSEIQTSLHGRFETQLG